MAKMSHDGREEALARLEAYVSKYSLDEVESADRIRFIDLQYKTAFTVPNFGYIVVNGERRQVYFIDEYHFGFTGGDVYHIRQWAELCEKKPYLLYKWKYTKCTFVKADQRLFFSKSSLL